MVSVTKGGNRIFNDIWAGVPSLALASLVLASTRFARMVGELGSKSDQIEANACFAG